VVWGFGAWVLAPTPPPPTPQSPIPNPHPHESKKNIYQKKDIN